ncbi:unnamed protein product [Amaranthus hypochondriacus]
MEEINKNRAPSELVFIPTPGMGHLISAVKLAKLILKRNKTTSILFIIINVPLNLSMVKSYIHSQSHHNPYPSRLTFHILPPLSNPPDPTTPNYLKNFIELHNPLVKQSVIDRATAGLSSPVGFIVDMLCTSMIDIATDLNIPSYIFFPSGTGFLNLMFHFQNMADLENIDIATKFSDPDIVFNMPGLENQITGKAVPRIFLEVEGGCSMILEHARRFRKCKGILINSYVELERLGFKALFDQVEMGQIPTVFPVGPILDLDEKIRSESNKEDEVESIVEWLDNQPLSSVVFLCFGSMGSFDEEQVKEIAKGLEDSGHRFLWSLRKPPSSEGKYGAPSLHETFVEALPQGFIDGTADRGKIIGWAPQALILAHPTIGGFVSHCGWNSTLESLWFGVPLATWPVYAEQQLNAFQLVKELGLSVEIRMDYRYVWKTKKGNFVVKAKEIENGIKKVMDLDEEMKSKVREMKNKGREALEIGGSSYDWLGRFIQDVLSKDA